ncbi:adenylyl cyclase-associated protein 1 isoform X2 [Nymphalis io]|uniref:adenylyl cyclase-associated protein 1 isoform X2 n=1 Tax=Inachis io TaxID=171585 RepID=UPI00216A0A2D|nr:adenylyl cyclase-associated protein 1 isoform X2 [Nymphalis io]
MFKSCCARPSKKVNKIKSENMDPLTNSSQGKENIEARNNISIDKQESPEKTCTPPQDCLKTEDNIVKVDNPVVLNTVSIEQNLKSPTTDCLDEESEEDTDMFAKPDFVNKRFSVDFKKSRIDFKRYSVDCGRNAVTLQDLANLEQELARTNVDVRIGRRKSTGILKSTSDSGEIDEKYRTKQTKTSQASCSDDDDVFEKASIPSDADGTREPPATPVGRDELALRRHRFFSDLVCAARGAVEHRVRFDPLGPLVAESGSEVDHSAAVHSPAADLESLIERLERVTSRLERLPVLRAHTPTPPCSPAPSPAGDASPIFQTSEIIVTDNMSINGYQDLMQGPLLTYLELSKQIGGDIATHANLVNDAFQQQFRYIQLAAVRSKPLQAEEVQLLAPTSEKISSIQQYREKNRASPFFNHLSAISESIPALGWVAVSPTPAPYVKEMNDAGQFYTNRVLKEWKEKDKTHVDWCRAWVQLLSDLQAYVKQYHTTGLVWAALRKVTSDMQTHKNPQLRQGPAPFKAAAPKVPTKALPTPGAGVLPDKPPVFSRDGKKWIIEYQKGNSNLVVENAEMNNVVYMFRCRDSALTVRGKINGVVLDSCTKCAVVFDNLVSSVEFVNCQSVQMQVLGKVPTISIDKTDGCQIYLSEESSAVEIVSSKSSEMNVLVPNGNGDYTEYPIPEQFKTVLNKPPTGLTTTPVENKG